MRLIDPARKYGRGEAEAINDRGEVAGVIFKQRLTRAYLLSEGKVQEIPGLSDGSNWPAAMNAQGQVTGSAAVGGEDHVRAFLWQRGMGKAQDLGALGGEESFAIGIGSNGDVVGEAETADGDFRATLWHGGEIIDLNSRLSPDAGWTLYYATAVNNRQQIVGVGRHNGKTRAFLLTPR
jgi:probable HAF family extracellular repeat protein